MIMFILTQLYKIRSHKHNMYMELSSYMKYCTDLEIYRESQEITDNHVARNRKFTRQVGGKWADTHIVAINIMGATQLSTIPHSFNPFSEHEFINLYRAKE